jgi:predicted nucleic acid-binding protein
MSHPLSSFQGPEIYLDNVILVGFLDDRSPWHTACQAFLYRAIGSSPRVRLITATLTVDETVFVLMQERLPRPPYNVTRNRSRYLLAHPEIVREMMNAVDTSVQALLDAIELEPVIPADTVAMRAEMGNSGLRPRDAIHLAVARRLGIPAIASDDDVFDPYPDITLYRP